MKILGTNEFLSSDEKYNINGINVGKMLLKAMAFPTEKTDMYLWFIALIVMHFCCIYYYVMKIDLIINIIIVYLTKYTSTISVYIYYYYYFNSML